MFTLTTVLLWTAYIMVVLMVALWIRGSLTFVDPHATYFAIHWNIPNEERSDEINSLHATGNKYFMSLMPWENFVLMDRIWHKLAYEPKMVYTKPKGESVDDTILKGMKLTFYFRYPTVFEKMKKFYIDGGFHTPVGTMYGEADLKDIQEFTLEEVESFVRDLGQGNDWKKIHRDREAMEKYLIDRANDDKSLFTDIGLEISKVKLSHPQLPEDLGKVIHRGAIENQLGQADVIKAGHQAIARQKLYDVDNANMSAAALRVVDDKTKVIISGGTSSLSKDIVGNVKVLEGVAND